MRKAAQVSVVKNGLPVPAARTMARPFSRWRIARRRMNGSQTLEMVIADCTRVGWPQGLHCLLQGHGVEDGGQHAHVIGGGAGDVASSANVAPADEIAASDDDRQFDAHVADIDAFLGDGFQFGAPDAYAALFTDASPLTLSRTRL